MRLTRRHIRLHSPSDAPLHGGSSGPAPASSPAGDGDDIAPKVEQSSRGTSDAHGARLQAGGAGHSKASDAQAVSSEGANDGDVLPVAAVTVDARGVAIGVLALIVFLYGMQWAQKFLIPLVFGVMISYTLSPPVTWMEKLRIPRTVGTCIIMLALLGGAYAASGPLINEALSIVDKLPDVTHKIARKIASGSSRSSAVEKMQRAAQEIEQAANKAAGTPPPSRQAAAPPPSARLPDLLLASSMSALEFAAQTTTVLFLVFFLLLTGDTYKRKLVKITGPTFAKKKITVQILDDINRSIQHYMFTLLVTNTALAILMWGALRLIGLENAGAWAVAAGLVHIIPYFGPLLIMIATGIAAFVQFGTLSAVALTAGSALAIATLIGVFVQTWMTGRIARMNPAAVFIGLLFWSWLWGPWGLLLGIPIIVVIKVVSEHIEELQPLAELLGD